MSQATDKSYCEIDPANATNIFKPSGLKYISLGLVTLYVLSYAQPATLSIPAVIVVFLIPIFPPTYRFPPRPTPPATVKAPVVVDVELVVFVILIALVVVAPLPVTDCKVPVFQIVTAPVDELIAVSVPAFKLLTNPPPVPEVRTC